MAGRTRPIGFLAPSRTNPAAAGKSSRVYAVDSGGHILPGWPIKVTGVACVPTLRWSVAVRPGWDTTVEEIAKAVQEHRDILEAIVAGDGDRAESVIRRHITAFEQAIRKVV